jgi:hypothetical protein
LVLVGQDPLADAARAGHPDVVMVGGHLWTRGEIEARLGSP